jgi:hypothetical protein
MVPTDRFSSGGWWRTGPAAAGASTKENPRLPYATGSAGLATLVRGSSRRIKIMRFRPANIRLINRRPNLPRLLLPLSSTNDKSKDNNKNNPIDVHRLTGHSISGNLCTSHAGTAKIPSGAKARQFAAAVSARLKSCPDTSRTCAKAPYRVRSYNFSSASQAARTPSSWLSCCATLLARWASSGSASIAFSRRATRHGV